MKGYSVAGYLGVEIYSDEVKFLLSPENNYISPDGKYAIGYSNSENICEKIYAFKLNNGKLECSIENNEKMETHLIQLALDQKKVTVFLSKKTKITGFNYPSE